MQGKQAQKQSLFKVHLIGGVICTLIAVSSAYFAGNAITQRRGLFLSARHELANTKAMLNKSATEQGGLLSQVKAFERSTSTQLELVSVKMLNARTADIVAIAESVDIRVDSLQPGERVRDKRVPVQPMRFVGNADADDVFSFLGLVGDRMPDIHIQSIDLLSTSLESSSVQIDMQLYWFIDPADLD